MIHISTNDRVVMVRADPGDLAPRHASQLNFWGLKSSDASDTFSGPIESAPELAPKIVNFFQRSGLQFDVTDDIQNLLESKQQAFGELQDAIAKGRKFKNAEIEDVSTIDFITFAKQELARPLKPHQLKAALHYLSVGHGANFSVPGSGKTSVILSVFHWLRTRNILDSLFVVGPPSCFGPWRHEYKEVIGKAPQFEILAGGDISLRRSKYQVNNDSVADLYLTTFQTLQRDADRARVMLEQQGIRFLLVIDEAHYIKQLDGAWASAVLGIARHATRRCVLTGTPFPRGYADAFNLFDVLWPDTPAISTEDRHRVVVFCEQQRWHHAAEIIEHSTGPLFYRVRKNDLGLAPQILHPPVIIRMNKHERLVYDLILDRVQRLSQSDFARNFDVLARLRRGRMMRLRQCLSYTHLLGTAVTDYSEDLIGDNPSVSDVIKHYDQLENPAKLERLLQMTQQFVANGEKLVIWSNFVRSLERIRDAINNAGIGVRLIYGATPVEKTEIEEELTREEIIAEFLDQHSSVKILVANPAACAESISLHKSCTRAIYYDLSYNCAQYLQSLDRIHRVGGSETRPSHYHFLHYADTIDPEILSNVRRKAEHMNRVIDQDYPVYSLDMFQEDDEVEGYEQLFGSNNKRL